MDLHIKSKLVSVHRAMEVLDGNDQVAYRVHSKALSVHNKTYLEDAQGNELAYIHAPAVSAHHVHYIEMADGESFELSEELFHIKDIVDVEGLGWQLRGSVLAFEFEVVDAEGRQLATAHRRYISLHSIYDLHIIAEDQVAKLVALFAVVHHIVTERNATAADATGFGVADIAGALE